MHRPNFSKTQRRVLIAVAALTAMAAGALGGGSASPRATDAAGADATAADGPFEDAAFDPSGRDGVDILVASNGFEDSGPAGPSGPSPVPPSANRPPVIDDPGITSTSMTVVVEPTVSDSDGDAVEFVVEVDGKALDPATKSIKLDRAAVGEEHTAEVAVIATDDRGAETRATFEHAVRAIDRVTIGPITYRLIDPNACFGRSQARRLTGLIELRGPIDASLLPDHELRPDKTTAELMKARTVEVEAALREQVKEISRFFIGNVNEFHVADHDGSATVNDTVGGSKNCRGVVTYRVQIEEL